MARARPAASGSQFPLVANGDKGNVIPLILSDPFQLKTSGPNSAGPVIRIEQPELDAAFQSSPPQLPAAIEANFNQLINAGVLDHPRTGAPVAAYVTYGPVKLRALRARPATSILWRVGWGWAAVDGDSEVVGPGDTDAESPESIASRNC